MAKQLGIVKVWPAIPVPSTPDWEIEGQKKKPLPTTFQNHSAVTADDKVDLAKFFAFQTPGDAMDAIFKGAMAEVQAGKTARMILGNFNSVTFDAVEYVVDVHQDMAKGQTVAKAMTVNGVALATTTATGLTVGAMVQAVAGAGAGAQAVAAGTTVLAASAWPVVIISFGVVLAVGFAFEASGLSSNYKDALGTLFDFGVNLRNGLINSDNLPDLPTNPQTDGVLAIDVNTSKEYVYVPNPSGPNTIKLLEGRYAVVEESGGGNDIFLRAGQLQAGNDKYSIIDGSAGNDTISYVAVTNLTGGLEIDLNEGVSTPRGPNYGLPLDLLDNIEHAIGTIYNDVIIGSDKANRITGDKGNDTLAGSGGHDIYVFSSAFGTDTINDSGKGDLLHVDGALLYGEAVKQGTAFKLGNYTLTLSGTTLTATKGSNSIVLQNWEEGDYGISLADGPLGTYTVYGVCGKEVVFPVGDPRGFELLGLQITGLVTPLVVDVDKDGIELAGIYSLASRFDIDNDGFTEYSGWVKPDDGFLVVDKNNNGLIDNQGEMFGRDASATAWAKLKTYDSNNDGKVNGSDTNWSKLKIWQDTNQNCWTDAGELIAPTAKGIYGFSLANDGYHSEDASLSMNVLDGRAAWYTSSGAAGGYYYDALLRTDQKLTEYVGSNLAAPPAFDPAMLDYPRFGAQGDVLPLHYALPAKPALKTLFDQQFLPLNLASPDNATDALINSILTEWAGKTGVTAGSRGSYVDAKLIATYEAFMGTGRADTISNPFYWNPGALSSDESKTFGTVWRNFFEDMKYTLLAQGSYAPLFPNAYFSFAEGLNTNRLYLNDSVEAVLARAQTLVPANANVNFYWSDIYNILRAHASNNLTYLGEDYPLDTQLQTAIHAVAGPNVILADRTIQVADNTTFAADLRIEYYISGGNGASTITGGSDNDHIYGNGGNDFITGSYTVNLIGAEYQADTIYGGAGNDTIDADQTDSDDSVVGGSFIDGGDGNDSIDADALATVYGGLGDDNIKKYGTGGYVSGDTGKDTIYGGGASTTLNGGDSDDNMQAGSSAILMQGGAGNDLLKSGVSNNTLDGGTGTDTAIYIFTNYNVNLTTGKATSLSNPNAPADTLISIESVIVDTGNNILIGSSANNTLEAADGNDSLDGSGGNDTLSGGGGNDTFTGGTGDDLFIVGNTANATVIINDFAVAGTVEKINLSAIGTSLALSLSQSGADTRFMAGSTTFILKNVVASGLKLDDFVGVSSLGVQAGTATAGNDTLTGTAAADNMDGLAGNDSISGLAGNDSLIGGTGNDTIDAGDGNDTLNGGTGANRLTGGLADDRFVIAADTVASTDTITDFNVASTVEKIDLQALGTSLALTVKQQGADTQFTVGNKTVVLSNVQASSLTTSDFLGVSSLLSQLNGTANADSITGSANADLIDALAGNDTVAGGNGNDTITGGTGNDSLDGGNNDDTFIIRQGDGADTINDYWGSGDKISFGSGVTWTGLTLTRNGNHLTVGVTGGGSLNLLDQFNMSSERIETFSFSDGTSKTWTDVQNRILTQVSTTGNDTITGFDTADTITGGTGNDSMDGGDGSDTYIINQAQGADTINDYWGSADKISFGASITWTGLTLTRNGNHLTVGITGGGTLNLQDQFDMSNERIETFSFSDGTSKTWQDIQNRILTSTTGNDTITGFKTADAISGGSGNDSLNGSDGIDTLTGGAGADILTGGWHADVFDFNAKTESSKTVTDRITDFNYGGADVIDVSGLGFTGLVAGAATGTLLGFAYDAALGKTVVTAVSDFKIILDGNIALAADDFTF